MQIKWLVYCCVFFIIGCGKKKDVEKAIQKQLVSFDAQLLPKREVPNSEATILLKDWAAYHDLNTTLDAFYDAENEEDLKLVIDDLIDQQKLLEKSSYPKTFNVPQIKSRQRVLKTYMLKVKAALEYKTGVQAPAKEFIVAYNSFVNQFSIIVNSTIDTKQILEDFE